MAQLCPMPEAPPVTIATLPETRPDTCWIAIGFSSLKLWHEYVGTDR
jgi:hypothetical protein